MGGVLGVTLFMGGNSSTIRAALEHASCECYAVVKRECDRLMPELARQAA